MPQTTPAAQATLELQLDNGDAPTGALLTGDGRRRTFSGWIELASAIEDWRQSHETTIEQPEGRGSR